MLCKHRSSIAYRRTSLSTIESSRFYTCFLLRCLQRCVTRFQCSRKEFIVGIPKVRLERILRSLRGIVARKFCEIFLSNHRTALDAHWYALLHQGCNAGMKPRHHWLRGYFRWMCSDNSTVTPPSKRWYHWLHGYFDDMQR